MHFLNSPPIMGQVKALTGGSASPHLNVGDIKNFLMPVPPRPDQDGIVEEIQRRLAAIDNIDREHRRGVDLIDRLEFAVLKKAFDGEPVFQGATDPLRQRALEEA